MMRLLAFMFPSREKPICAGAVVLAWICLTCLFSLSRAVMAAMPDFEVEIEYSEYLSLYEDAERPGIEILVPLTDYAATDMRYGSRTSRAGRNCLSGLTNTAPSSGK